MLSFYFHTTAMGKFILMSLLNASSLQGLTHGKN